MLVSLEQLFGAVREGPQAGRRDTITGLEYHAAEPPPASAAADCMHWVSDPQVRTVPAALPSSPLYHV